MDGDTSFGRLLRRLRKERDLTQEALAQQAYCAVDTIKKIEAGVRRPSRQLAAQFADCLSLAGDQRAAFLAAARARPDLHEQETAPSHAAPPGTAHAPTLPTAMTPDTGDISTAPPRLPPPPNPFVGRVTELAELGRMLTDPAIRLISIVGLGGVGKTRLAVALAERLSTAERFPDGACFVALAPIAHVDHIIPAIAEALDFPLDAGRQHARSSRQQVFDYLRARRLLLVLDNVEHLLGDANAGAGAADLVTALLDAAPGLAILATSRERLRLREEQVYPLGGLDMPGDERSPSYGAVALFLQRARLLRPDFAPEPDDLAVVARICRLVEGMPLAIELAAGWVDALALPDIAAEIARSLDLLATELHDVPARQRSVRAAFDGSWRRLGGAERAAFARLAVFRGGGTRDALQAIAATTLPRLHTLVGASLLHYDAGGDRYTVHELLRQYAAEQLAADPAEEQETYERHTAYYCALVEQRGAQLSGPEQSAALAALDGERENIRAAWDWAVAHGRIGLLAQAIDGMGYFYERRAYFDDGEHAYRRAAEQLAARQTGDEVAKRVLAALRAWQGCFSRLRGDLPAAEQLLSQSLALLDGSALAARDTRAERAFVLLQLGLVATEGPLEHARRYFEESLALYQLLDRRWEASNVLVMLGDLARYQGAFAEARRHFQASLAIRTARGDRRGIAEVLDLDSHVAAETGQADEAELLARRSYAIHEQLGDRVSRAFGLGELGVMLMWTGKYGEARDMLQQSLDLYQDLGDRTRATFAQGRLVVAFLATGQYEAARALSQQGAAQARELLGSGGLAFVLHYAGLVALTLGVYREAEALLQESAALYRQAGNVGQLGWSLALLGYTHWLLGETPRARAELLEVIHRTVRYHDILSLLLALPAIALMLAEQGRPERAVELYALAWRHPMIANAQSSSEISGRRLEAVFAALPANVAATARARGWALDLWETAATLAEELAALGWEEDVRESENPTCPSDP